MAPKYIEGTAAAKPVLARELGQTTFFLLH